MILISHELIISTFDAPAGNSNGVYVDHELLLVSPVLVSSHALLINWSRQLLGVWEDVVVVEDDRLHHLVHMSLTRHLVQRLRRGQQGGAEHDGQVPGVHHVLVAVLREAGGRQQDGHL